MARKTTRRSDQTPDQTLDHSLDDCRATARAQALAWVSSAWRSEQILRALEDRESRH